MPNILFILLLLFIKENNSSEIHINNKEIEIIQIEPGTSNTTFIKYLNETIFTFNVNEESDLQVNIHSINCNIDINSNGTIENQNDLNIYSLKLNSTNNDIIIKPIIDIVEGRAKENYQLKNCPIIINSYYIGNDSQKELKLLNKEENIFYCPSIYEEALNISYIINNISNDSFVSLNFKIKETPILIYISYINDKNEINSKSKIIDESTYIYLNSEFLLYNSDDINSNGILYISIESKNNKSDYMYLKLIEENTVCLLEKSALNFGFITSKTTHQYYYTEVLIGEEGELMLHNKRNYGIFYAKIIDKSKINNIIDLYDTSIYPNSTNDELEYDHHYLRLKYNNSNETNCPNGCYLLITYEQIKSLGDFPLVGYEFTILSRTWDQSDYIPSIIDIPYNEYIIGCFGKGSAREHYYSFYIPDEAEKIIIQLEGNSYFNAYYENGRKKINTLKEEKKSLEIKDDQNVLNLNASELRSDGNIISLAFRPISYYTSIIASYYFRVLYKKENETKYLPMDSNLGNLCTPEKNNSSNYYYCYLKLKNDYDESNIKFAVTSTNQNEYAKINITKIYKKENNESYYYYYYYVYDKIIIDIDYFLFEFEFKNDGLKNIISSFCDKINETYPQIYSAQMHYLDNITKFHHFNLKNNFSGDYQFITGDSGKEVDYFSSPSFKGKLITFRVDNGTENFSTVTDQYIYYIQIMQNLKSVTIDELEQGKPLVQFTDIDYFPLLYYYKIQNKDYINVNINFKLSEHNKTIPKNYTFKAIILNEDAIIRKSNGEFIEEPNPIVGNYSDAYGIGFLSVNQKFKGNDTQYLLISLEKSDKIRDEPESPFFFVESVVKEYDNNNGFFLPKNEYIIDTFDDENNNIRAINQYNISNPEGNAIQLVVEFSTKYSDITIDFLNVSSSDEGNKSGFRKYVINEENIDTIQINVKNPNKKDTNYMIRYYFNDSNDEYSFSLNVNCDKNITYVNDTHANVKLIFEKIKLEKSILIGNDLITFFITGDLYKSENSPETINNTCFLHERQINFKNKTFVDYHDDRNWAIEFSNIPRDKNDIYDLRLQIIARILNNNYKEEFLAYTTKVDLTEIRPEKSKPWLPWGIPVIVVGSILIIVLVYFVVKFLRLQKTNTNLQNEMVSLAFSNDVQKNVLNKDIELSRNDSDYESTFI